MAAMLDLETVMKTRRVNDHLSLRENKSVKKMLKKMGASDETVAFSDFIVKINPKEKPQERVLLITDKATYNLMPTDYAKCKRRIALPLIEYITVSKISDEFVLHVPSDYDYRLMSLRKREVIDCLNQNYQAVTGNQLTVEVSKEIVLRSICVTKAQAKKNRKKGIQRASHANSSMKVKAPASATGSVTGWGTTESNVKPDDFELLKVIGRGSFGKVMQVRHKKDGAIYAMKILRKEAIIERNQVEHTMAERQILQKINHPFLMRMHYSFQTPTKLYFVMDMIIGGELFFHLKNDRRFDENRAKFYTAEIMMGLEHLHSKNIIYRDLKPENILLDQDGHVVLTDFGLSKEFSNPHEKAQTFCGTPEYLAPEVVIGVGHDKAVDWWSLGILLYEMLVGLPPFYSENTNIMYELIEKAELRIPGFVSYHARDLLKKLLEREPARRLGSADDDSAPIRAHPFFSSLDFDKLYTKDVQPPFRPNVSNSTDTRNFDTEFTNERVVDSVVPDSALTKAKGKAFDGFTYKEESAMGGM